MSFLFVDKERLSYQTLPLNSVIWSKDSLPGKGPFSLHNHEALEIILLLEGRLQVEVDGREYVLMPGDTMLANPYALHEGKWLSSGENDRYLCLTATLSRLCAYPYSPLYEYSEALENGRYRFDEFYPAGENRIAEDLTGLHTAYTDKSGVNECRTLMLFYALLGSLFDGHYHPNDLPRNTRKNDEFSREVSLYISANYHRDIATTDAAAALHMELSQFCRLFKQTFGVPFRSRLCHYRCIRAAERYRDTAVPITDIAAAVGFSDYSYFSKSFKKYIGQSPAYYFRKWNPSGDAALK